MFNLVTQTLISSIQNQAADDVTAISFAVVAVFATDKGGGRISCGSLVFPVRSARNDPDLVVRQWALQRLGFIPQRAQPDVAFLNG